MGWVGRVLAELMRNTLCSDKTSAREKTMQENEEVVEKKEREFIRRRNNKKKVDEEEEELNSGEEERGREKQGKKRERECRRRRRRRSKERKRKRRERKSERHIYSKRLQNCFFVWQETQKKIRPDHYQSFLLVLCQLLYLKSFASWHLVSKATVF
uniref:Uncharacterized protein n=1 Tax=Cacopsylla melanoneura TaxID=428564 RepID=A0A8D8TST6_9HEMI